MRLKFFGRIGIQTRCTGFLILDSLSLSLCFRGRRWFFHSIIWLIFIDFISSSWRADQQRKSEGESKRRSGLFLTIAFRDASLRGILRNVVIFWTRYSSFWTLYYSRVKTRFLRNVASLWTFLLIFFSRYSIRMLFTDEPAERLSLKIAATLPTSFTLLGIVHNSKFHCTLFHSCRTAI